MSDRSRDSSDSDEEKKKQVKPREVLVDTGFTQSMTKLSETAEHLSQESRDLREALYLEYLRFENLKVNIQKEKEIMKRRGTSKDQEIVELNVGGQNFTTFKSTLLKAESSMLAAMFSGKYNPGIKDRS